MHATISQVKDQASGDGLLERFERRLSAQERAVVQLAREWADQRGAGLYCVGGTVRDPLLGRVHLDLDLAIDGDSVALAEALGTALSARVTSHAHFGTAAVSGPDWSIDIARTRSERYSYPAALPEVAPAPIAADLARRDFTINAMALELNGAARGTLIDPCGGVADLDARLLRGLHTETFRDDPTRILRLARYAARLEFGVEHETHTLARRDSAFLAAASPARITHELERTCLEPRPEQSFQMLQQLGAFTAIYPLFRVSDRLDAVFDRLRSDGGPPPAFTEYLASIAATWDRAATQGLAGALELRAETLAALRDLPSALLTLRSLAAETADPAEVVIRLSRHSLPAVRGAAAAIGGDAARIMRRYLNSWRSVRPALDGDDLIALGVPSGPRVGEVLALLRAGRLRQELASAEDERALVAGWLRSNDAGGGKKR